MLAADVYLCYAVGIDPKRQESAMQIVILDGYPVSHGDLNYDAFRQFGTVSVYDRTPDELVVQRLRGADAVLVNKVHLGSQEIESAKSLQYIGVLATGYDVVDGMAARRRGIPVCNVPAYSTDAVAQLTFALLLEIACRVGYHSRQVHLGAWTACPDFAYYETSPVELGGLTLGILGCGAIGTRVARIGAAFGMNVLGCSPHRHPDFPGKQVSVDELFASADVLSLHCPATPTTMGIINAETLSKMKDGSILLNTARGSLLNEADVADALASGKLAGAGVDVVSREPIGRSNPLLNAPNCVITGHYAWTPQSARQRLLDVSVENLRRFLAGKPQNVVN